ncbi:MAG: HD domain-containing phosphohydrolase [Christensenellales bacterium]|jgi:HD-GYP domain-containing protein (c-di-GMP phosphodiesterase class II)/CheY-like chemotaxis protein
MRKTKTKDLSREYKIMLVDDEEGIVDIVGALLERNGYWSIGFTNPMDGIEELRREKYDILVLDYYMHPLRGDMVVESIRKFDKELYILLLTGHKDLAPPIETIKSLDIQAYCEKSDRLDQLQLLIESGIKSISQMRLIKKFQEGLNSILGAVPKIYQLQPIGNILEEILEQILPLVNSKDAFILIDELDEKGGGQQSIFRGIGKFMAPLERFSEILGPNLLELIGRARAGNEVIEKDNGVAIPLSNDTRNSIGVLFVGGKQSLEGIKLLQIYASQAASSINNASLHSLVNTKNEELIHTYAQLKRRYMDTIEVLRLTVDAKDEYTRGHSDRVSYYSQVIGKRMGLSEDELERLHLAGIFHDIGKIGTADDILLKRRALTKEEYDEIKKHPSKGAMILSAVSMFQDVVPIVLHHHERYDGKGYSDGLKGEEIGISARILAVADAFDAMTSDRHYRTHLTLEEAKKQLVQGSNTQFDKRVVDAFLDILETDAEVKKNAASQDFMR